MHRLLFSFLICTAVQRASAGISGPGWDFLLRGAAPGAAEGGGERERERERERSATKAASKQLPPPLAAWLSSATWSTLQALERSVSELEGLTQSLIAQVGPHAHVHTSSHRWSSYYTLFHYVPRISLCATTCSRRRGEISHSVRIQTCLNAYPSCQPV